MAKIPIGGLLSLSLKTPSIDAKYGPYLNIQEALYELGPDKRDALVYGLTVGITQQDGNIKEYIITKIDNSDNITVNNFKEKNKPALGWSIEDLDSELQEKITSNNSGSIYSSVTYTDNVDQIKDVRIKNFPVDIKDCTLLVVTFEYGNEIDDVELNINNTGSIPLYYKGKPFDIILDPLTSLNLIYDKSKQLWNVLNDLEYTSLIWR